MCLACSLPRVYADSELFKPESDDVIVAELPADVVELAAQVRVSTSNVSTLKIFDPQQQALQIMDAYRLASSSSSARAYGHTLSLIRSWPSEIELPPILRLIKADVLQHNHGFDQALQELDVVLARDPSNLLALQMKSQVHLVTGDYASVQHVCSSLAALGHGMSASNCQAQLDGVTGAARPALALVESLLQSQAVNSNDALELTTTAASLAHRLGEHSLAEHYYTSALRIDPDSTYLLINYADWLLERGRANEAATLLARESGNTNKLELRIVYIQALVETGASEAAGEYLTEIGETIAVISRRAEERPSKLLARYYLTISHDYDSAHREALRNWQVQKEPGDSLLLARSAVAAEREDSLKTLLSWYHETGQEDYRLKELFNRYEISE